ncbi:hypothetical protein BV898_16284 [Hypsibius exemplaris]|uniref:Arrestin C-terminal-like domain-containing protein n=1 Tax=Hypsibius exemplaris TaxID=2072580 RepID=A0A9X6NJZ3_HYPEX|nr:hypothetical protein BV898_16284 [Hypsibius exemplaris]
MRDATRLQVFDIELLCDQEEYHLGDSISGAIVIEPRHGQIIAKLRVGIHAVVKTSWLNGSGKHHSARSSMHREDSGKQTCHAVHYFDVERSVYENRRASAPSGPDLLKLRNISRLGLTGPEEFPFIFKLPERGAPPSWHGLYGSVRYWIEAVVEVCGKDCFREDVQQGIIIAPSVGDVLPSPLAQVQKFPVAGMACVSSSISASIQPDKPSYQPGETVHLSVSIKNTSPWRVSSRVSLLNAQIFVGKNATQKLIKDVLTQVEGEPIRAGSDATQWTALLRVPANAYASLLDCALIKCQYTAVLRLRVRSVIPQQFEVSVPVVVARRTDLGEDERSVLEADIASGDRTPNDPRKPLAKDLAFVK